MNNTITIGSWNLCLGLFHKKDYVRTLLSTNKIDILNLQETEIPFSVSTSILGITDYTIEIEKTQTLRRVATYIKKTVRYKRRMYIEPEGGHMIVIDILGTSPYRLVNIYRPFNPKGLAEFTFFNNQLNHLDKLMTERCIIIGDFNLDLNKQTDNNYYRKTYFTLMSNILGHHALDQIIHDNTWKRIINGIETTSRLDHIYTTRSDSINNVKLTDNAYSDHLMLTFTLESAQKEGQVINLWKRSWKHYKKELLCEELSRLDWNIETNDAQSYYNILENLIVNVVDKLAPMKMYSINKKQTCEMSSSMRRLINLKRRKLVNPIEQIQ